MIHTNGRGLDAEDVGVLFHAITRYADANEALLNRSLVTVGYATLLQRAELAAEQVALLHDDEGEDWDGVVWFERLEDIGEESLAAGLFATDEPDVTALVMKWLLSFRW